MIIKYIVLSIFVIIIAFCGCSEQLESARESMTEYKIYYELDGGVNHPGNPSKYVSSDLPITIIDPIKTGCIFEGWVSEALGKGSTFKNAIILAGTSGDISMSANWRNDGSSTSGVVVAPESNKQIVYDFAEFDEEDFPRGMWTTNQILCKYGERGEIKIHYIYEYRIATVIIELNDIKIISGNILEPALFSFYNDFVETGYYSMEEKDKEVSFEVGGLTIHDSAIKLPRNIVIGKSTKEQVIAAYPEETPYSLKNEEFGYDLINYVYAFFDEDGNILEDSNGGPVSYYFDENELLTYIEVFWWFSGE